MSVTEKCKCNSLPCCIVAGKNFASWVHTVEKLEGLLGAKAIPSQDCPAEMIPLPATASLSFVDLEATVKQVNGAEMQFDGEVWQVHLPEIEQGFSLAGHDHERQTALAKVLGFPVTDGEGEVA